MSVVEQDVAVDRAVRRGTPTDCTLEDGRAALAVALAAEESCRTGQPVRTGASLASC